MLLTAPAQANLLEERLFSPQNTPTPIQTSAAFQTTSALPSVITTESTPLAYNEGTSTTAPIIEATDSTGTKAGELNSESSNSQIVPSAALDKPPLWSLMDPEGYRRHQDPIFHKFLAAAEYLRQTLTTTAGVSWNGPGSNYTLELGVPSAHPWRDGFTIEALTSRPGFIIELKPGSDFFQKKAVAFKVDIETIVDPTLRSHPYFDALRGQVFEGIFVKIEPLHGPNDC